MSLPSPRQLRTALADRFAHHLPAGIAGTVEIVPTQDREWWQAEYRCPGKPVACKRLMAADDIEQAREVAREVIAWVTDEVGSSGLELDVTRVTERDA